MHKALQVNINGCKQFFDYAACPYPEGMNGAVILTVTNTKKFLLPQTGGRGLYLVTIIGVAAVAGGCSLMSRKKDLSMK